MCFYHFYQYTIVYVYFANSGTRPKLYFSEDCKAIDGIGLHISFAVHTDVDHSSASCEAEWGISNISIDEFFRCGIISVAAWASKQRSLSWGVPCLSSHENGLRRLNMIERIWTLTTLTCILILILFAIRCQGQSNLKLPLTSNSVHWSVWPRSAVHLR